MMNNQLATTAPQKGLSLYTAEPRYPIAKGLTGKNLKVVKNRHHSLMIADAVKDPLLKTELAVLISSFITQASAVSGMKGMEQQSPETTAEISKELLRIFRDDYGKRLTIAEARYILREGMVGNLGTTQEGTRTFGISPRSVNLWIREYLDHQLPPAMRYNMQLLEQEEKATPKKEESPEEYGKEYARAFANTADMLMKSKLGRENLTYKAVPEQLVKVGFVIYDRLEKIGALDFTTEQKWEIYREELENAKLEIQQEGVPGQRLSNRQMASIMKSVAGNEEAVLKRVARTRSKGRCVRQYVADLVSKGESVLKNFELLGLC